MQSFDSCLLSEGASATYIMAVIYAAAAPAVSCTAPAPVTYAAAAPVVTYDAAAPVIVAALAAHAAPAAT